MRPTLKPQRVAVVTSFLTGESVGDLSARYSTSREEIEDVIRQAVYGLSSMVSMAAEREVARMEQA